MSSHHIVRDDQEPTLIIHHLNPEHSDQLSSLLEWSPIVLVCESALNKYIEMNRKLDMAVVGLANLKFWQQELESQQPVKLFALPDGNCLDDAMLIMNRNSYQSVNIMTSDDGLAECLKSVSEWCSQINFVILTENNKHAVVSKNTFVKWMMRGVEVGIYSFRPITVQTDGFVDDLSNTRIFEAVTLVTNDDGIVRIDVDEAPFVVVEKLSRPDS